MSNSSIKWYQEGFETLNPLRYHLHRLIEEIESYNRLGSALGYPPVLVHPLAEAKKASDAAEAFFTTQS